MVLLSHNHYDHMDEASLLALSRQTGGPPLFIMPLGHKLWFARRGIHHVIELDWWDSHVLAATPRSARIPVTLTPAQHWSARTATDALRSLWGGFALLSPDCHLFFAGDTAYSKDFADIRQHFAQAHTPARTGWRLRPGPATHRRLRATLVHEGPACESGGGGADFQGLGCKRALAVHWGTFQLTDEALDEPPRALARGTAGPRPEPS